MTALEKIQKVVSDEIGENVSPETRLMTLVTDSLEMVALIQELEAALEVEILDCDAENLFTVQDIVDYAEAHK
jgi:acyl carrier protein